jgi:hypothetical protein
MSRFYTQPRYDAKKLPPAIGGAPTNATFTGEWISIHDIESMAFQVQVAGTGNPNAAWDLDITNDLNAPNRTDAQLDPPFTTTTRTTEMTGANPAGAGVAINALLGFYQGDTNRPFPRAKFARMKLTVSGGGAATGLKIAYAGRGI